MDIVGLLLFLAGLVTTGVAVGQIFGTVFGFLVIGIGAMLIGYRMYSVGVVAEVQKSIRRLG